MCEEQNPSKPPMLLCADRRSSHQVLVELNRETLTPWASSGHHAQGLSVRIF